MKRAVSLICLLLAVIILFAACTAQQPKTDGPTQPTEGSGGLVNSRGEKRVDTMNGTIIKYFHKLSNDETEGDFMSFLHETNLCDIALARKAAIEAAYDCKIETTYSSLTGDEMVSAIVEAYATGKAFTDIVDTESLGDQFKLCNGDCLYPLVDVKEYLNYEIAEKYGPANLLEGTMRNSVPYMVTGYSLPEHQNTCGNPTMIFDVKLIKENNLTDIREYYEQGKWTFDFFENTFLPTYTIQVGERNIIACAAPKPINVVNGAIYSNGAMPYREQDGTYVNNLDCDEILYAIDWVSKILREHGDQLKTCGSFANSQQMLINKDAFMAIDEFANIFRVFAYNVEEFGIVPFPSGPNGNYGNNPSLSSIRAYGITKGTESPEYVAVVLSELLETFEEYPDRESLKEFYSTMFFDERDINVFFSMSDNARSYYFSAGWSSFGTYVGNAIAENKTAAEIVSAYKETFNEVVTKYIVPNYDYMHSHQ